MSDEFLEFIGIMTILSVFIIVGFLLGKISSDDYAMFVNKQCYVDKYEPACELLKDKHLGGRE